MISIHAPRAGATILCFLNHKQQLFQSTPPVRGATHDEEQLGAVDREFQSTPPVRGATQKLGIANLSAQIFQSTLPVRGATILYVHKAILIQISIHAPRAGGDCSRPIQAYLHY